MKFTRTHKWILLAIIMVSIGGMLVTQFGDTQVRGPAYWRRVSGSLRPTIGTNEIGASGARISKIWLDDLDVTTMTIGPSTGDITIQKADPSLILDVISAGDTDFWIGVQDDAGGDDDDTFQIGDSTTPGTNPFLTIDTDGNVGINTIAPATLLHLADTTGVTIGDGNDTDQDLMTVDVTGTPKLWWDEATDSFEFNKSVTIPGGSLKLGSVVITDSNGCLTTNEFHAHGSGGVAGYIKLAHGTNPFAHKEADHSILWSNDDKLYFEKEDGTDIEIPLAPAAEYLQASLGSDQTNFKTGNDIKFDTVDTFAGTSISLNTSTGVFTLEAGKTYKLATGIRFEYSAAAKVGFAWYDITNSVEISVLASLRSQSSTAHFSTLPVVETIITPTVETQVSVRCVWEGDEVEDVNAGYVWAIIEVMAGTTSPVGVWDRSGTNLSPVTAGDDVLLNTGETLSIADMTTGSIPFIGASGLFSQDNANLFWDDTNNRFGIGTSNLSSQLNVAGDIEIGAANAFYYGDPSTDGTWQIVRDGTKLSFQRRESGAYVEKGYFDSSFHADTIYVGTVELSDSGGSLQVDGGDPGIGTTTIYNLSTGLKKGGVITVNGGNSTLIDISAGSGQIVDSTTDPNNPILTPITWNAKTGYNLTTMPDPGDVVAIYIALDAGGNVVEREALPTPEERRNTIDLGIAARLDTGLIVFAGSGPTNVLHNPSAQFQDFLESWGPFNIDGNRIQPNAADLQIKKTEGTVFRNGVNFQTDGKNPHRTVLAEQAPVDPFNYKLGDGTDITLGASQIDPDNYDDGTSTLATVPDNKWTIQYITIFASGVVEVLYGQEVFDIEQDAIIAISNIDFIIPTDSREAIPLAYVILQQGDTSLPTDRFYRISRGGKAGGNVATTFLGLLNLQTGWLSGGSFSFPGGKNLGMGETYFMIADQSDGNAITVEKYTFPADASIPTGIGVNEELWVTLYAPGGVPTIKFYTLSEYDSDFSNIIRNYAVIGRIWSDGTGDLTGGRNYVIKSYGSYGLLYDLFDILGFSHNKEGNNFYCSGANKLGKYVGKSMRLNARVATDTDSSNIGIDPAVVDFPDLYYFIKDDSVSYTLHSDVQINQWYNPDTSAIETMPANKWTTQLLCFWPVSQLPTVHYGWKLYSSLADAKAARHDDFYENVGNTGTVRRAWLFIKTGTNTLEEKLSAGDAEFLAMPNLYFGSGGGAGSGIANYWNRTETELSPANVGDSVILATQTELSNYPNFSADPGWTFSGSNTWTYDSVNDRMRPIGEVAGDTITDTGIALTNGKTYVVSLSWLKFIGTGSLQIYQGSAGTQKSDYINDGTYSSQKWMFTASASENLFVRSTGDFHSDTTVNYISELSVIEVDNEGDIVSDRVALGGLKPEYFSQLDSYGDAAVFFPAGKGILSVDGFEIRNVNSGGLDFDETYARIIIASYDTSVVFGSNGYATTSLRGDSDIYLRTYTAGGAITLNESSIDADYVLNGNGVEAYKYDAGDAIHIFNGNVGIGATTPKSPLHIKGNAPGTVGSHPAGQIIIQNPTASVWANTCITGYTSDVNGDPINQSWYLGGASSSNSHITFLNRRNANLQFGTNSATRMTITGSGNVGIGTTDIEAWQSNFRALEIGVGSAVWGATTGVPRLWLTDNFYYDGAWKHKTTGKGIGATFYDGEFTIKTAPSGTIDTAAILTERFTLSNTGQLDVPGVYAETDASAANVTIASDGSLRRSTSSRKIKKDIIEDVNPDWALQFRPVTFKAKADDSEHIGFVAEDMRNIDSRFATNGDLPGLEMNAIVSTLTALCQRQEVEIKELRNRIESLEEK